jgi:hypothetical protein
MMPRESRTKSGTRIGSASEDGKASVGVRCVGSARRGGRRGDLAGDWIQVVGR